MTSGYLVYFYPYEVVGQSLLFTGSNYPHALLHSPEMPDRFLLDMQLELASCKSGSFKFGIVSENPLYSELRRSFRWEVLVFFRNRTGAERFLFGGYPVQRETDIYGITTFTCDGVMGYLNQVYLPAFRSVSVPIGTFYSQVVLQYNREMRDISGTIRSRAQKRHRTFHITYSTAWDTEHPDGITRDTAKSLTAMDVLQTRLVDYFGGELSVQKMSDAIIERAKDPILWVLNYRQYDTGNVAGQTIEVGKNVTELSFAYDTTTFYTALVPVNTEGDALCTGDNGEMVYPSTGSVQVRRRANSVVFRNESLVEQYGLIVGPLDKFSDTGTEQASVIGTTMLAAAALQPPKVTFAGKAKDLALITGDAPLEIGQYVWFRRGALRLLLRVSKLTVSLSDPSQNEIELSGYIPGDDLLQY